MLILLIKEELEKRADTGEYTGSFQPVSQFFGYEGRAALPSNFDAQYCYAIGRNAVALIHSGLNGYMSTIKNLENSDPKNWVCSGMLLPAMMGLEKRRGKVKPVISKYLVDLEGGMYKAYEAVRDKWSIYDCYQSPGPIQFHDPTFLDTPFLVKPPDIEKLLEETHM